MPANIMLPTKAKITALVCSGRMRLNVNHDVSKLSCQKLNCSAASRPTSIPIRPHPIEAIMNARTEPSS